MSVEIHEITVRRTQGNKNYPVWYELLLVKYDKKTGILTIDEGKNANVINYRSWSCEVCHRIKELYAGYECSYTSDEMKYLKEPINRVVLEEELGDPSRLSADGIIAILREMCWQMPLKVPVKIESHKDGFITQISFDPSLADAKKICDDILKSPDIHGNSIAIDVKGCDFGMIILNNRTGRLYGPHHTEFISPAIDTISEIIKKHQYFPK